MSKSDFSFLSLLSLNFVLHEDRVEQNFVYGSVPYFNSNCPSLELSWRGEMCSNTLYGDSEFTGSIHLNPEE